MSKTYITGARMMYDPAVLKSLDMFGAALRRGRYLATWRILHIDGFEGTPRIPQRSGRQIQFFDFETRPLLALDSCGCCREEVPEADARLRAGLPLHFTVQAAPPASPYHRYVSDVDIAAERTPGAPAALSAPYGSEQNRTATQTFGIPNWLEEQK